MSLIKEKVLEMADQDEEIEPTEFQNLILDEVTITQFSEADKAYLEEFVNLDMFGLNATKLNSLVNFPNSPSIIRLELNENMLKGDQLVHLKHLANLNVLKLANNRVADLASIEVLKGLPLKNLDLMSNPVCDGENYREKVFQMFPDLEILDQMNQAGEEIISEVSDGYGDEDSDLDDDSGELDEGDLKEANEDAYNKLTEQEKKALAEQGIDAQNYMQMIADEDEDYDDEEYGEEEDDGYGDEEGQQPGPDESEDPSKQQESGSENGAPNKRQKTD